MLNINANIVGRLMKYGIPTPPAPKGNLLGLSVELDDEVVITKNMFAHTVSVLTRESDAIDLNTQTVNYALDGVIATDSMDADNIDLSTQTVCIDLNGVIADESLDTNVE